jgi:hypothetical protein
MQVVLCPFQEHGCRMKMKRMDVEMHLEEDLPSHFMLLQLKLKQVQHQSQLENAKNQEIIHQLKVKVSNLEKMTESLIESQDRLEKNMQQPEFHK